ncbi:hypothetical protein QQP08_019348 [Theobroma cacao]|nr:hypothetical protein QQP08_019348 [Theobroma cacao]
MSNMAFDVVELVTLSFHKGSHVQEYLMEFDQVLLYLLNSIMPFLNFGYGIHNLTSSLFLDGPLQEAFAFTTRYQILNRVFISLLPCDDDPGPQPGMLRLAALERSKASSFPLMILTLLRTCSTSVSIRARSCFMVFALCTVLLSSLASCNALYSRSTFFMSSFTFSTSSKNLSRLTLSFPASMSSRMDEAAV